MGFVGDYHAEFARLQPAAHLTSVRTAYRNAAAHSAANVAAAGSNRRPYTAPDMDTAAFGCCPDACLYAYIATIFYANGFIYSNAAPNGDFDACAAG